MVQGEIAKGFQLTGWNPEDLSVEINNCIRHGTAHIGMNSVKKKLQMLAKYVSIMFVLPIIL